MNLSKLVTTFFPFGNFRVVPSQFRPAGPSPGPVTPLPSAEADKQSRQALHMPRPARLRVEICLHLARSPFVVILRAPGKDFQGSVHKRKRCCPGVQRRLHQDESLEPHHPAVPDDNQLDPSFLFNFRVCPQADMGNHLARPALLLHLLRILLLLHSLCLAQSSDFKGGQEQCLSSRHCILSRHVERD